MPDFGSMVIVLKNGTKFYLHYDNDLYHRIVENRQNMRSGDVLTIEGEGWPMTVQFELEQLESIEATIKVNKRFYS